MERAVAVDPHRGLGTGLVQGAQEASGHVVGAAPEGGDPGGVGPGGQRVVEGSPCGGPHSGRGADASGGPGSAGRSVADAALTGVAADSAAASEPCPGSGTSFTAVPYATTSLMFWVISLQSNRRPRTASAPADSAISTARAMASWRDQVSMLT